MLDDRVFTRSEIVPIFVSSIVVSRMGRPTRIIMYRDYHMEEYVVTKEYLESRNPQGTDSCMFVHHSFEDGGYHPYKCAKRPAATVSEIEARYNAEAQFKERTRKLIEVSF